MRYPALIDVDGDRIVAEFPDCPGCQVAVDPDQDIVAAATTGLQRWLESCLVQGAIPSKPSVAVVTRDWFEWIQIPSDLAARLLLQWAQAKRISRTELARRAGISESDLMSLEDPNARPSPEVLEGVSRALGVLDGSITAKRHDPAVTRRSNVKTKSARRRR